MNPLVSNIETIYQPLEPPIKLPSPRLQGAMPLEQTLAARRSVRTFTAARLELEELGQLLWAAQGMTERAQGLRTAPSAGGLYPVELYAYLPDGVFHYRPERHELFPVEMRDRRHDLAAAAFDQPQVAQAAADLLFVGLEYRTEERYGHRGVRYILLETGHSAQNVLLQATALGLGAVPVGAFHDHAIGTQLSLAAGAVPLYIVAVGRLL